MHSDKFIYYILRYGLSILGAITFIFLGLRHVYPESWLFMDPEPPRSWETAIALLFGLTFILAPLTYLNKLVLVELDNTYITINTKGEKLHAQWSDVESIEMHTTKFFPYYKLKLKNIDRHFLFNTNNWSRQLFWSDDDPSDMGQLIMAKKKELNI